jgi:hypothetical protein
MHLVRKKKGLCAASTVGGRGFSHACITLALLVIGFACGCGSGGATSNPPGAHGDTSYNTYAGSQSVSTALNPISLSVAEGGVWTINIDDSSRYFNYSNTSLANTGTPPSVGYFSRANGFVNLTLTSGASGGYAVEIPGRATLLRPGGSASFPVATVQTNACTSLLSNTVFQFITFPPDDGGVVAGFQDSTVYAAYGSVKISTQGPTWNFSGLRMFQLDGTSLSPTALPSATCALTPEGYAATIAPTSQTQNFATSIAIGPSGFFMLDEGQAARQLLIDIYRTEPPTTPTWPLALAGFEQPANPLDTNRVVAGRYAGFEFASLWDGINWRLTSPMPVTQPVYFGLVPASGTVIAGGLFPNDDVTQTPATSITLDLGSQDADNNGLYKSVLVTMPDPNGACVSRPYGGTDANGNPTCIFQGIAIVGNPDNKFAIFVVVNDARAQTYQLIAPAVPLEFLLYQQ